MLSVSAILQGKFEGKLDSYGQKHMKKGYVADRKQEHDLPGKVELLAL